MRCFKWWVGIVVLLSACGDDDGSGLDAAFRDRLDAEVDSGGDTEGRDDGGPEAGPSVPDAMADAEPDAEPDAPPDAGPDGSEGCADADRDGAYDAACGGDDCDDANPAIYPSNFEHCGNDVDDDCSDATPDVFDNDEDGVTCFTDCNDDDPLEPMTTGACSGVVYATDFEAGPVGWTTSYEGQSVGSWILGTPNKHDLKTAASGLNAWITGSDAWHNNDELSYVTSPVLDLSALDHDPLLMISAFYDAEPGLDMMYVEHQVDGGEFVRTGAQGGGVNWYVEDVDLAEADTWTGYPEVKDRWFTAFHRLEGVAGSSEVRIRFVFRSDMSVVSAGAGFDDVRVLASFPDVGMQAIEAPPTTCEGSDDLPVSVEVHNRGNEAFSTLTLAYQVNDGSEVVQAFDVDLPPGARAALTFSEPVQISEPGEYRIAFEVADERDAFADDDFAATTITTLPAIPVDDAYLEDFEASDGAWVAFGENARWRWGSPDDPYLGAPASGQHAWYAHHDEAWEHERSYLQSPCFDFSALTADPVLHMRLNYHYIDVDESRAFVELSNDGGRSWSKLGTQGSGGNWYTTEEGWTGPSYTGGEWRTAAHRLTGAAGKSAAIVRFAMEHDLATKPSTGIDDVRISRSAPDLAVESARVKVEVGCASRDSDTLVVDLRNHGNETVGGFDLSYAIDDEPAVTVHVAQSIAPLGAYHHEFALGSELAAVGPHAIEVTVSAPSDPIASNDGVTAKTWTQQISDGLGYEESFEVNDGSWRATGIDPAWAWAMPDGFEVPEATSGLRAWLTGPEVGYADRERSVLTSPCFDFTAASSDPSFRFMHFFESDGSDNLAWLEISLDAGEHWSKVGSSEDDPAPGWYDSDDRWTNSELFLDDWHLASHALPGAAGESAVLVRFVFDASGHYYGNSSTGHGVDDIAIEP